MSVPTFLVRTDRFCTRSSMELQVLGKLSSYSHCYSKQYWQSSLGRIRQRLTLVHVSNASLQVVASLAFGKRWVQGVEQSLSCKAQHMPVGKAGRRLQML